MGTATTAQVNGRAVTTVTIDPEKLANILAAEDRGATVAISLNAKSDTIVGELTGQMIKNMEHRQFCRSRRT